MRPVSNPPNPWASHHVEWIDAPPPPADLEIYEEHAKSIVSENDSPDIGFRFSLNPYRGCFHACAYCLSGETRVSMGDGSSRAIRDLVVGDTIVGTRSRASRRVLVRTRVLAHWSTTKPAWRLVLADGTELVASGDHRFLAREGWKYVAPDANTGCAHTRIQPGDDLVRATELVPRRESRHIAETVLQAARSSPIGHPGRVVALEPLGSVIPMYDITTGTGDFIANGVVSHNCYARPSHQYWDFGAGTDFERKIVVKVNAPELLRERFMKKSWTGELIAFSGNTDCYQPLEASYELTRRCLEVCAEFRNPVSIITKGALVRRDAALIARIAREARAHVNVSVAFADDAMARKIEPSAPAPSKRFEALRALAEAGIPVGVGVAPIIPGLNDSQLTEVLERARENGASTAFMTLLRLPAEVKPVFLGRLEEAYPDRLRKVTHAVEDVRGGALYRNGFGERMRGTGARWDAIDALFDLTCRRLGLNARDEFDDVALGMGRVGTEDGAEPEATTFRRPGDQLSLFVGGGTSVDAKRDSGRGR